MALPAEGEEAAVRVTVALEMVASMAAVEGDLIQEALRLEQGGRVCFLSPILLHPVQINSRGFNDKTYPHSAVARAAFFLSDL